MSDKKAFLLLEDGRLFEGRSMGCEGKAFGRAVFHTSSVGYQEAITNPANAGLLLVQTFPLIGNYGVNDFGDESDRAWINGYVVREICDCPSNYLCKGTLEDYLTEKGVVGICGIDTRCLTRHIRQNGEMKGVICTEGLFDKEALLKEMAAWQPENAVARQGLAGGEATGGDRADYTLLVLDMGAPRSFSHTLVERGARVLLRPATVSAGEVKGMQVDGIVLSDGPGDPRENPAIIANVRELVSLGLPVLGISLGHQVLALSQGMKVHEMKCGHRGANQPVYRVENGRTYITTQNHAWAVDADSVNDEAAAVSYVNANDKTVEGLRYRGIPAVSVQFIPDSKPGSQSTSYIYDDFFAMLKGKGNNHAAE